MAKYFDESKVTYQQLVMRQIQKIQEIASKELRDGTKTVKNLIGEQEIDAEDTRYSYLQSIEMLGSMLSPYFNSSDVKANFENFCLLYDMELLDALDDEDFSKELGLALNIKEKIKETVIADEEYQVHANTYFLKEKIKVARRLFRELVNLFKENDFLASESYGEGKEGQDDSLDAEEAEDTEECLY